MIELSMRYEIETRREELHPPTIPAHIESVRGRSLPDEVVIHSSGDSDHLLTAWNGQTCVGYAITGPALEIQNCYLCEIAVDPDCRRSGIGKLLVLGATEWMIQLGLENMFAALIEDDDLPHRVAFFESMGFVAQTPQCDHRVPLNQLLVELNVQLGRAHDSRDIS
jgi:ribosomal protein S18 acetylase RimI-like enzyme